MEVDMTVIEEVDLRVNRARKQGFTITSQPGTVVRDGRYETTQYCTPLEAIVLGEESSGDLVTDVAAALNVSRDWVCGFTAGLSLRFSNSELTRLS